MTRSPCLSGPPLTARQMSGAALCGLVLWLAAALLLRVIGPMGVYDGAARVALYLAIIPGTVPVLWLMRRLARLQAGQMVPAMAMGTGTATIMDGIALAWFPDLYGAGVALHAGAGGTILWGGGIGLLLAFWCDRARGGPA
ncbi:MAG: hypothetical protein O2898_07460 [Proteobacteria bacterium]|nr:hypothetical protein [Pseudomonadota bacterium]